MDRRIGHIIATLSLASLLLVLGPSALVPRATAQDRSGPPSRERDQGERPSRWDRAPRGDRGPGEGRSGRRRPRPADSEGDRPNRSARTSAPSSSSASTSSSSDATSKSSGGGPDLRGYARSLVSQNDKNGNMMLEGDERAGLRGEAAKSDLNGDGVITVDELVMHLSAPNADGSSAASTSSRGGDANQREAFGRSRRWSGSPSSTSSGASDGKSGQADKVTNDAAKSYRFKPAKERLPDGLPSFFSRDANGDGQISMSEYSRRWSDRTVAEFRRYDLNGDGMITPKECLKRK